MSRFAFVILLLLAACSPNKVVESQLTTAERQLFRGSINDLAQGNSQSLERRAAPQLVAKLRPAEAAMQAMMPGPPVQVDLVYANWSIGRDRSAKAVYQVRGGNRWALVETASKTSGGITVLTGIYVQPLKDDPKRLNGFNLATAGISQWAVLLAAIAAFGTTIAALIHIWRSGLFERRWLWTIGSLFGVMLVRVNWTTGEVGFQPLSLQLFSASALKQPIFAPWIIGVSLPLVAIIALMKKRGPDEEPHLNETVNDA